jgi:4-amino-4-deoxy-L-arabinose transferase-like glycosyltransferase
LFILFLLVYESILYAGIGLRQPTWADEHHFIPTIEKFGREISLKQLKTYNDMSTPLPFILYALWGKLIGFHLHQLRFFSLIIAFFTFLSFFIYYVKISGRIKTALLVTLFLIFQPYSIGISVFVYTDMLALFFLAWALFAFQKEKPTLLAFSLSGALLCRQYFIFLAGAFFLYYLLQMIFNQNRNSFKMIISTIISVLPLFSLVILWHGFSPENEMRNLYLQKGLYFHTEFLVLYICLFAVYLFPMIIYRWKKYYRNRILLLYSLLISFIYFLFPVKASEPAVSVGVYTVGFFHRFIRMILGSSSEHFVFYIMFLISLPVVLSVIKDAYFQVIHKNLTAFLFTNLSIIFFLIIMPFSYLNWEKYFLPIIPIAFIQMLGSDVFKFFGRSLKAAAD